MISANFIARFYIRLKQAYGLDIRALSLMRIGLALVLLFDLCIRANSLTAHYTERGAVPFKAVELAFWKPGYFSLFEFSDTYGFAVFIFCLTGIVYLFLLVGYKTRFFTLLSWFLLISLQNRNTLILQGGDDMLRLLLFWAIFFPWGSYYSVDHKLAQALPAPKEKKLLSMATLGYILLLASAYFFTGVLKNGSEWTSEGTAIYYTLSLDQMTWPLGKILLQHTTLLKYLTLFVRWFELLMPLFLFIPFKNGSFRLMFVLGIAAFQIGIALTLFVGLFYLICLMSLIGLLPSFVLDKFDKIIKYKELPARKSRITSLMQKLQKNYYLKVILNCFLFFCITLCMLWNISTVQGAGLTVSDRFYTFGYSLRFNQSWGMFAPSVLKDDGWYVLEGTTADSLKIDINRNGAKADYSKPVLTLTYIKDDRWRKFLENYIFTYNAFIRPYYCNYILKEWNMEHPKKKIVSLEVIYMKEMSLPPGQKQTATREMLCRCVD